MTIYLDPKDELEYVLQADRDEEEPLTFLYHPFTARESKILQKKKADDVAVMEAALAKVYGWRNCRSRSGEEIEFSPERLWHLNANDLSELAVAVVQREEVTADEAGN